MTGLTSIGDESMKLLFCYWCRDLFKLRLTEKSCECGYTKGSYKSDGDRAWHNGVGILLAIRNPDFYKMLTEEAITSFEADGAVVFRYKDMKGKIEVRPPEIVASSVN